MIDVFSSTLTHLDATLCPAQAVCCVATEEICSSWVPSVNNRKHEGSDPGRWLRHEAAPAHAERSQTAGGILQQTHPAAPGGGAGQGERHEICFLPSDLFHLFDHSSHLPPPYVCVCARLGWTMWF